MTLINIVQCERWCKILLRFLAQDGPQIARVMRSNVWQRFLTPGQCSIFKSYFDFGTYDGIAVVNLGELYLRIFDSEPAKMRIETVVYLPSQDDKVLRDYLQGLLR